MPKKPKAPKVAAQPVATVAPIVLTDPKADQERIAAEARDAAGQMLAATQRKRRQQSLLVTGGQGVTSNRSLLAQASAQPMA